MDAVRQYIQNERNALNALEAGLGAPSSSTPSTNDADVQALKTVVLQNQAQITALQGAVNDLVDAINKLAAMQDLEWAQDLRKWQTKNDKQPANKG